MDTHRTPDALSTQAENELICDRLLGWKRCPSCGEQQWYCNYDLRDPTSGPFRTLVTPSFTTWAEAGLILEAFESLHIGRAISWQTHHSGDCRDRHHASLEWGIGEHASKFAQGVAAAAPLAIRAAALAYIRSQS